MESNKNHFCISIDGSIFSEMGFDLVVNDLYKPGDKISLIHICNKSKLSQIPYQFLPEVISETYETKLLGKFKKDVYTVIIEERKQNEHALEQVFEKCSSKACNVLVVGHSGHKTLKQVKTDLSKGLDMIIRKAKIPTIIMRESINRKKKPILTWLICLTLTNSNSFKGFEFATEFIHKNDKVIGYHVRSEKNANEEECLTVEFNKLCDSKGIVDRSVIFKDKVDKRETIAKSIINFVNFTETYVDFLVLGLNSQKYDSYQDIPAYEVIKMAETNFLFYTS